MKLKDLQLLIPGWNFAYILRDYAAFLRREAQRNQAFVDFQVQSRRALALAQSYAAQRDAAKARGEDDVASGFDRKIAF
jgi:hypothetical protein